MYLVGVREATHAGHPSMAIPVQIDHYVSSLCIFMLVNAYVKPIYRKDIMTTTVGSLGRLCNGLIRNIAVSMLSEKFDLKTTYQYADEMKALGLSLFSGRKAYPAVFRLNDANYIEVFNRSILLANLHTVSEHCYLQTPEISALVYSFLRRAAIYTSIMAANPYKQFYKNNNFTFLHVRLTDVRHYSPGSKYFLKAIAATQFSTLYIASDNLEDEIIKEITAVYPNAVLFSATPIQTLQFGSTCRNIILSGGSFSAMIGMLALFSTVQYPESSNIGYDSVNGIHNRQWCGDMFSGHGWTMVSYK
jgi:hypothetical protein